MTIEEMLKKVDHTNLSVTATSADIEKLCKEAILFNTAAVCIPPSFVSFTKEYMSNQGGNTPKICTVIGFPNGYNTTEIKVFETRNAVENGAEEIDMVINIGWLKEKQWDKIESEIAAIRQACEGKILKVIIETCLLNTDEKFMMCKLVSRSGADYIKTSTGFSTGGATKEDIAFFSEHISNGLKIKAAGGISSFEDAEAMIKLGASRLGTSRLVKLALKSGKDDKSDSSY